MITPVDSKSKDLPAPPPYPQADASTPLNAQPQTQYGVQEPHPTTYVPVIVCRDSPLKRFFRAFVLACGVWLLLTLFLQTFITVVRRSYSPRPLGYDYPSNITLGHCADEEWEDLGPRVSNRKFIVPQLETSDRKSDFPFRSKVSFDLPLDSNVLSIISRGPNSGGSLDIVTDPEQAEGTVKYSIVASYYKKEILKRARVCAFSRDGDERGVGIFTPRYEYPRRWQDRMFIETTIIIPEQSDLQDRTRVKKLTSDVPNTVQRTSHLAEKVLFDSINLQGTNGAILASSLEATTGKVVTSNGIIRGTYSSPGPLKISSTNGHIDISVGLNAKEQGATSDLTLHTTNGDIKAAVSLLNSENVEAPLYSITGKTSNGRISASFPTAPVASTLKLGLHTSNGPAEVKLHPTFEGSLSAATSSYMTAKINVDNSVEDPSGRGRKREVTLQGSNGRKVQGLVYWAGDGKKAKGDVKVQTSNSPVAIFL